jgi:hypothetical protein
LKAGGISLNTIQYPRTITKPVWNGPDIRGLTILLYFDQEIGDTIQFIRSAHLIAQKGAKVIVARPGINGK